MNKIELLEKIDSLIAKAKTNESDAETNVEIMYHLGQQNGLLWARFFILELEEIKDDEEEN